MKVALLYPTVAALVEKMASIFPGLTVVGPVPDQMSQWDNRILKLADAAKRVDEWRELGLDVKFDQRPYSQIDFSVYDLLIESVETFYYSADWRNHCERVECPIIVKVCWINTTGDFPASYLNKVAKFPLLLEMPAHETFWRNTCFQDVTLVPEPVGDWWFERPWTGANGKALFVLAGKDIWRPADITVCGVDWWNRIEERFPGRTFHQDGAVDFKTSKQMTELYAESRVFCQLDRGEARPLAASFTEALAAGMPVVARRHPTLSYDKYIDGYQNGLCTDDFENMCEFIDLCLSDFRFAQECSLHSRKVGRASFSAQALRPIYMKAAERSRAAWR